MVRHLALEGTPLGATAAAPGGDGLDGFGAPSPPAPSPLALLAGCLGSATLRLTELLLGGCGGL